MMFKVLGAQQNVEKPVDWGHWSAASTEENRHRSGAKMNPNLAVRETTTADHTAIRDQDQKVLHTQIQQTSINTASSGNVEPWRLAALTRRGLRTMCL